MAGRGEALVSQDAVADNLAVIGYPLALYRPCQEEVLCSDVLGSDTISGNICNCVRFVLAFSYAMFVVFYPFIYQSLCVEFGIDRIRNPSPDRSTKKPFVMGARSLHADVTVDCETDIYGFQGPDCSLCQAI